MTDTLHHQILTALQDRIDPLAFQACMCDLLRDVFPGLVPITGGTDGGMDGAVADGQGEPFPLVCTTSKDVIGNLTHNLDSYLKNRGPRRQVVLATSQSLTPQRQGNLRKRAQEKNFVLLQVYEQSAVADRLYYSPRWCKELLGLFGTPPALSTLPRTRRPHLEIDLIGRDADVEWLKTTTGDRLITGQPGSGKTFLLHHLARQGPLSQLREMQAVWEEGRDAIKGLDSMTWRHLKVALWGWIYPRYAAGTSVVPEEVVTAMHTFAGKVLRDVAPMVRESPGLVTDLTRLARTVGLDLLLEVDPVFELLYPANDESLEEWQQKEPVGLRVVAERWTSKRDPHDIAKKLALYLDEATRIDHRKWPPRTQTLCRFMAEATRKPELWLEAFLDVKMPGELLEPFLERAMKLKPSGWERQVERCFDVDSQAWAVTSLILEQADPPAPLLNLALARATYFPEQIETLCLRNQVSIQNLKALLANPDQKTALAVAVAEWHSDPRGQVREELQKEWRSAILSYSPSDESAYLLEEIFAETSEISFAWLRELLKRRALPSLSQVIDHNAFDKAVGALEERHRIAIVDGLEDVPDLAVLLPRLIDRRPVVYERLLAQRHLRRYHLLPLEGIPDSAWKEMALLALATGYEPPDIAVASFSLTRVEVIWRSGQDHWHQWDQAFAAFADHPEQELREVARHGRSIAQNHILDATSEKRRGELFGT